jgi:NADH dehydrogenase
MAIGWSEALPHVVIVGGGFAGIEAARALRRVPVRVTVIDQRNHYLFQPLLYQVAMAALSPNDIAAPIRWMLRRQRNVRVMLAEVTAVDLAGRRLTLADGDLVPYDYLILAAGGRTSYFGHDAWCRVAPGLKSVEDALEIRRRVLVAYEVAEREPDPAARQRLLTFVVVGGGPTGVELAGALVEIARHTLRPDFRVIDTSQTRVVLVEGGPRLLATYPESLSQSARRQLERLGVEVVVGATVTDITSDTVTLSNQRQMEAATVLWAAGVAAVPLTATLGVEVDRGGRIVVEPDLSIPGHPEAYAVGDLALIRRDGGRPVPGVAPAAMQAGRAAAGNIARRLAGQPARAFHYVDKGDVATIGRSAGVMNLFGRLRISGLLAWLAWLFIHLWYLISFDNRLIVFTKWAWSYFTFRRSARLITGSPTLPPHRPRPAPEGVRPAPERVEAAPAAASALEAAAEARPGQDGSA